MLMQYSLYYSTSDIELTKYFTVMDDYYVDPVLLCV